MNLSMYHHLTQHIGGTLLYFVKMVTHPNSYPIFEFFIMNVSMKYHHLSPLIGSTCKDGYTPQ